MATGVADVPGKTCDPDGGQERRMSSRLPCDIQAFRRFLCSSECTAESITPELVEMLFSFFDCSPLAESQDSVQKNDLESALMCFIKVVHLVHGTDLQQCEVDLPSLLKKYLGILKSSRHTSDALGLGDQIEKIISMLDAIPRLLDCRDSAVLQAVFVGIGSFEDIFSTLDVGISASTVELDALCINCIKAFGVMTKASHAAKEVFKASVGYKRLCDCLRNIQQPSDALITVLFDWIVEGEHSGGSEVINNIDVLLMTLDWLPALSIKHRRDVTESLQLLCKASTHNAMLCCTTGVFSKITSLMDAEHQTIDLTWAASLAGILEGLGSHSVTSSELKQMVALFRPLQDGSQIRYGSRLLRALVKMTSKNNQKRAKHYFNLQHPSAGISVPAFSKWTGNGFTFHAWICVDPSLCSDSEQKDFTRITVFRRQLYSVFTTGGSGLEAFLTRDGRLMIGVCHKKDYVTATVRDLCLSDGKWHSVAVVHCPSRRLFGQSSMSVYVDGKLRHNGPMRLPSLSEELASCYIGCGGPQAFNASQRSPTNIGNKVISKFPFSAWKTGHHGGAHAPENDSCIPAGTQDDVWGVPTSLQGQLGPVCMFTEGLQEGHIVSLHTAGPNDLNLFQPSDVDGVSQPTLPELSGKLVLYYNAKAGREHMCSDLVQPQSERGILNGRLTGHRCATQVMKDVLPCLGGLRIFLPLLEQIHNYKDTVCDEEATPNAHPLLINGTEEEAITSADPELTKRREGTNPIMDLELTNRAGEETTTITEPELTYKTEETNPTMNSELTNRTGEETNPTVKPELTDTIGEETSASTDPEITNRTGEETIARTDPELIKKAWEENTPSMKDESPEERRPKQATSDEWIMVKNEFQSVERNINQLCELPCGSDSALFLYLLVNILKDEDSRDEDLGETLSLVGYILRRANAQCINLAVVRSVQALAECTSGSEVLHSVHTHLLFNFGIWSSSEFDVRVSHVQYLSTLIKDQSLHFRTDFGVKFFLDVVRLYYGESVEDNSDETTRPGSVQLTEKETKTIRGSLLGLVKFYLTEKVKSEEATNVVEYLAGLRDSEHVTEMVEILLSLCERSSKSRMVKRLSEPAHVSVLVSLLITQRQEKVQLKILKLMADILTSPKVPARNKDFWRLSDVGFSGVTECLTGELSANVVEALLHLGASELPEDKGVEAYVYFDVVLAVVRKIAGMGLHLKLFVSQMILRSIDASHSSLKRFAEERGWHHTLLQLITGSPRDQHEQDDVTDLIEDLVDTVLEIVFRVLWRGVQGYDDDAWKERGQAFAALSTIASMESFVRAPRVLERNLLELCVQGAVEDIRQSGETGASETRNALMVMRLVEDFLFTPDAISGTGPYQDADSWSVKLVHAVVELLEALNVWDVSEENGEWVEMAQVGLRILLGFISRQEPEFCATASSKLSKILKSRVINSQGEVCYILGRLHKAYVASNGTDCCHNNTFIIPVIRLLLLKYQEQLPLTIYVPSFGHASGSASPSSKLDEDFTELTTGEEFQAFMKQQIYPGMKQYQSTFLESSLTSGRFWMECLTALTTCLKEKDQGRETGQEAFRAKIHEPFKQLQDQQTSYGQILRRETQLRSNRMGRRWQFLKRKLKSERSTWESRVPGETHWKLSMNENFQRMRLRLIQNFSFDPHTEASLARDNQHSSAASRGPGMPVKVAKEAVVQNAGDDRLDEEDTGITPPTSPKQRSRTFSETEKQVLLEDCELITLMDSVPGRLELTTTHVYFFAKKDGEIETAGQDFMWALTELREVHLRRHNLRRSALEFFLIDQTNYFMNFDKEVRNKVYKKIMSLKPPNLYYSGARSPAQQLKTSGLTEKWVRREISNFQYLMQLNTIAGRTYNDLSQYPVFPWILVDYSSQELDLNNPEVYRDLSKPVGALNPDRTGAIRERYDNFVDPSGLISKFHYGTHYSSAAGVLHYLIRVEPFTSLHIDLQSGRFDCADRQFHDLPALWHSLYHKASDTKELIPEFFYFPEFLENLNRFDLGRLQSEKVVDDVVLPPWASSPEEFIFKHRKALESDHVSDNLHQWIDLIFGFRQKGPAAEEALNVFYYCTYEGAVDLDAITDPCERKATEGMINNFGQTPAQLLTHPHPQRMSVREAAEAAAEPTVGTRRHFQNVFDAVDKLKAYFVPVSVAHDPLVFVAGSMVQAWSLIHHGMPETLITLSQSGTLGVHDWLPYSKTRSRPFTFELDPSVGVAKLRRSIAGPFDPNIPICPRLFAVTHDAKLVITSGHWDNSFRVFNLKGRLLCRIVAHSDVITCLSLDADGHHLMTGSRDTTCRLWSVQHQSGQTLGLSTSPLQTLCGHDREITCVAIRWEMDLAVSGSKDGTCIVYSARRGEYVRTLRTMGTQPCSNPEPWEVVSLGLSEYGDIVFFCKKDEARLLCHHSVNGKLLASDSDLKEEVTDMIVAGDFLITAGSRGRLAFRSLHSFRELKKINLLVRARCVCLARDNTHVFVCLDDGKLIIIAVDTS